MMAGQPLAMERSSIKFLPDPARVALRPFIPSQPWRVQNVIQRVNSLDDEAVHALLDNVLAEFAGRHSDLERILESHCQRVQKFLGPGFKPGGARRLLLGSYLTAEYSLESAALFNPSIVAHPCQDGVPPGSVRFIMSLRATGEGHISSIEFRSGILDEHGTVSVDPTGRHVTTPEVELEASYNKDLFQRKLREMGVDDGFAREAMGRLAEPFTLGQLTRSLEETQEGREAEPRPRQQVRSERRTRDAMRWLAEANYQVRFPADIPLPGRIIFPVSTSESNGIEDARFVRLADDDGSLTYYATYTAYNGKTILPNLLETTDFLTFRVRTLNGPAVQNKGMALFPRRLAGRYAMISRQDNENLFLMFSDHLHFWHTTQKLIQPIQPWEFMQIGNCGSPIETEAGWLLLTHGVGPMRKYCIGALLLDLEDPSKVIGRLAEPLLSPDESEREGYVPNVVYSCGSMVHQGRLITPYAMSDWASSIATVSLDTLLERLKSDRIRS